MCAGKNIPCERTKVDPGKIRETTIGYSEGGRNKVSVSEGMFASFNATAGSAFKLFGKNFWTYVSILVSRRSTGVTSV